MNQILVATLCCDRCGAPLGDEREPCPRCGEPAAVPAAAIAKVPRAAGRGELVARSAPIAAARGPFPAILNRRWVVIGLLLVVGPIGLPALWWSRRFRRGTKIAVTVGFFLVTVVVPLAAAWYWLDVALQPLVDAFSAVQSGG